LDFAQHYGVDPEEYWHEHYFAEDPNYFKDQVDAFFRLWSSSEVRRPIALDVGAGLGKAMKTLARRGLDAYGIEPSEEFARAAIERGGIPSDRLQCASVEGAEFPGKTFDFVTFGAVLEHVHDPGGAIERALGWCAPGGLVHLEVPSSRWLMNRLFNFAYRVRGLDYCANISPMHVPYHLYEFGLESFRRHGQRAGYHIVEARQYVGDTYLPSPASRIASRVMAATGTGMQLELWLRPGPG
jgi:SAM-dependent methyltransferase